MPMHVGQAEMPPLEFVRQPFVVDAQEMQNRRLKIVGVHRFFGHVEGKVVA